MKKIISLVIALACISTIKAQYVNDALRFSQNFPTLSARSMSMGGAFTSLGGDFSSSLVNPAGLGLYRKSEIVFSPGLGYANTKSSYLSQSNEDYKYQFIIGNVGFVGNYNSGNETGLVSAAYSIGYNRLNNFNSNIFIRGNNTTSSFSDLFVNNATDNQISPDNLNPFGERLFYDAWLMDNQGTAHDYVSLVPVPIEQTRTISTSGGTGEWTFAGGLNFSNRVYVGIGMGLTALDYHQTLIHSEVYNGSESPFRSFDYREDLDVAGRGFTMNIGVIARIAEKLRVGTAFELPTFYNLTEDYFNSVYSEFDDSTFNITPTDVNGNELGKGRFEYKLNTPMKMRLGLSYQIGKSGIISGDVEYIDYTRMKMRSNPDFNTSSDRETITSTNDDIDQVYRSVFNFKLGGEVRFGNFAVRAGGAYYPSVYSSEELNKDASHGEITGGFGYRNSNFFFDLGMSALLHSEKYNLYYDNVANLNQSKYRFIATVGLRF